MNYFWSFSGSAWWPHKPVFILQIIAIIFFIYRLGLQKFTVAVDGKVQLPCNFTVVPDDSVVLILWYKSGNATGPPIYTVDSRDVPLELGKHFISNQYKRRANFNLSVHSSQLTIEPVRKEDSGQYSCRIDYKWSRTFISAVSLNVVGKQDVKTLQFNS